MSRTAWPAPLLAALFAAGIAQADVWDEQTQNDDGPGGGNELVHGSDQVHDLGVRPGPLPDEDWFPLSIKPYSSYEVVVDGTSGDIGPPLQVDRVTFARTPKPSAGVYADLVRANGVPTA